MNNKYVAVIWGAAATTSAAAAAVAAAAAAISIKSNPFENLWASKLSADKNVQKKQQQQRNHIHKSHSSNIPTQQNQA